MSERGAAVIIIGAGIVGTSIAYHLAVRGCTDVLILEKAETEVTGSTARSAAGVRHQFATEINIRLSLYSIEQLKHFAEEVGGHADLKQVGYLLLVNDEQTWEDYRRNVTLQNSLGVRSCLLPGGEILNFIPGTRVDDLLGATYCPDDGYCNPHGIATGYLAGARKLGVRLKRLSPAIAVQKSAGRVVAVQTPLEVFGCEMVVNAAGPWAGQVGALAGLDIPVLPYRRCVYMTEPFALIPNDIPLTIDVGSDFYMRKENQKVLFGIMEIYQVREQLESYAARVAAERMDAQGLARLKQIIEQMHEGAAAGYAKETFETDVDLHKTIIRATQNNRMIAILATLDDQMHRIRSMWPRTPLWLDGTLAEHDLIVSCISDRDPDGAEEAMRKHLRSSCEHAIRFLMPTRMD